MAKIRIRKLPGVPRCIRHKIEMRRSAQFSFLWVCPDCRGGKRRTSAKRDYA